MCFTPQRRALFRHLNFQKWCEAKVFCTFWLGNVLRATMACTFSTSQLPKVARPWCVLYISLRNLLRATTACNFSSLIWPAGSAPAALASLLFDPPEPQIRDFPTFSRICICFLLTLSLLWSSLFYSPLLSASAQLCFSSVHIVGSLTSKLPSMKKISQHVVAVWTDHFHQMNQGTWTQKAFLCSEQEQQQSGRWATYPQKWTTLRIKSTGRDEFTLYGKRKIFAKDFHTTFRELLQRRHVLSFLENHQTNSSFNPWIPMGNLKRLRQTPLPSEALSQPSKVYSPTFFNRHLEQRAGETRKGPIGLWDKDLLCLQTSPDWLHTLWHLKPPKMVWEITFLL